MSHIGLHANRTKREPRERIFAREWRALNRKCPTRPSSVLDWLLHSEGLGYDAEKCTANEETIAATVIQWLGSPVGWQWLQDTLGKIEKE